MACSSLWTRSSPSCTRPRACLDRAGVYAAGASVAGVLLDPLGAPVGRAARLQPAVPLVRGPGHGRRGVEPCRLLQEPRPAADERGGATVFRGGEQAGEALHE